MTEKISVNRMVIKHLDDGNFKGLENKKNAGCKCYLKPMKGQISLMDCPHGEYRCTTCVPFGKKKEYSLVHTTSPGDVNSIYGRWEIFLNDKGTNITCPDNKGTSLICPGYFLFQEIVDILNKNQEKNDNV